jgi:glycosyltransferase involved in cell wall biosynthesis
MKILYIVPNEVKGNGVIEVASLIGKNLVENHNCKIDVLNTKKNNDEYKKKMHDLGLGYFSLDSKDFDIKNYNLIHFHGLYTLRLIPFFLKVIRHKIPYIISFHGNLMKQALKKSKYKKKIALMFYLKYFINHASLLHALTIEEKKAIAFITENKVEVIPNGIEIDNEIKVKNPLNPKILFLGRIDVRHKGLDIIIKMICKYHKELHSMNITFDFVGGFSSKFDSNYFGSEFIKQPVLGEICHLHGPKYGVEKKKFLENASIFLHMSRYEGMPIAVLEAMSFGIPVIVTKETNMADIVNESRSGKVVNFDEDELFIALKNYIEQPINKEILLVQNREYLSKNLRWEKISKDSYEMYKKVLGISR